MVLGRAAGEDMDFTITKQVPMPGAFSKRHLLINFQLGTGTWSVMDVSQVGTSIEKKSGELVSLKGKGWYPIETGEVLALRGNEARIGFDLRAEKAETAGYNGACAVSNIKDYLSLRDGIGYFRLRDPSYLGFGMNIPGRKSADREIIAIRKDPETENFLAEVKGEFSGKKLSARAAKRLCKFVRACFTETFEDSQKGWEGIAERYRSFKVSLGYFLGIHSGCCRHQAAALVLACQELNFPARYVRGSLTSNKEERHAWVEILINGRGYIADPAMGDFLAVDGVMDRQGQRSRYFTGDNVVEVACHNEDSPGGKGTILLPAAPTS